MHKQTLAMVNKLSADGKFIIGKEQVEVDSKLKYLIETLNKIPGVATDSSCQGHSSKTKSRLAEIFIVVDKRFNIFIAARIIYNAIKNMPTIENSVVIEWTTSNYDIDEPTLILSFDWHFAGEIRKRLRKFENV